MTLPLLKAADRDRIWFRTISEHIYATSGIHIHAENRTIYERRVRELMQSHRAGHLRDYYMRLRFHPRGRLLTQELIEAITTGETYFYRESKQLDFFAKRLLPGLLADRPDPAEPVRIWSVGCSTGEEPYSLAIMAMEAGLGPGDVEIIGGDISQRSLAAARNGVYRDSAFRALPHGWREHHFERESDGRYRIGDRARQLVEFTWMNLMDREALGLVPAPDAVFCRNVLIYFDRAAKLRAIENLHRCVRPGGVLLLGHAESLLHLEHPFLPEQVLGEIVYRKAAE